MKLFDRLLLFFYLLFRLRELAALRNAALAFHQACSTRGLDVALADGRIRGLIFNNIEDMEPRGILNLYKVALCGAARLLESGAAPKSVFSCIREGITDRAKLVANKQQTNNK